MTGYLIIFKEDNNVQSGLYDESLQYIQDIDLYSEEAFDHLSQAEEMDNPMARELWFRVEDEVVEAKVEPS